MPATITVALEMIELAAEMGERFPDKHDAEVLADVEEAFCFEYDDLLDEDHVLGRVVLYAYQRCSVEQALEYARRVYKVRI